jgi:hypothetical protein
MRRDPPGEPGESVLAAFHGFLLKQRRAFDIKTPGQEKRRQTSFGRSRA